MPLTQLLQDFVVLKRGRRLDARLALGQIGRFAKDGHQVLALAARGHDVRWRGSGQKQYRVYSHIGEVRPWSRGVNKDLYIDDCNEFADRWDELEAAILAHAGTGKVGGIDSEEINSVIYTAVMSWSASVDLFSPSNGLPGTFFEMLVGPLISILSGRPETGDVRIDVAFSELETVKVDLTFHDVDGKSSLAVPTKISTRERISQAYVHARILESAFPGRYRTVLGIVNENNLFHDRGTPKSKQSVETAFLTDTLVPGTISLYQKYISRLDGLYYLDPPYRYISAAPEGFPPVGTLGKLLAEDLPTLL